MLLLAATEIVTDGPALTSDPTPSLSSTVPSISSDALALRWSRVDRSLSLTTNFTTSIQFHIPDSPIDLTFTSFGWPLIYSTVYETIDLAVDQIKTSVALHPTESITNGFFRQRHGELVIIVYAYPGHQVTWYLLYQLLLGIQYWTSQFEKSTEMRFHIEVEGKGRVGYGSLWDLGMGGSNIARRAVNATSQQSPTTSVSKLALTNSTDSARSPLPNEAYLVFSYHFYGRRVPEAAMLACFQRARQSIGLHVQYSPLFTIPNNRFQHGAAGSPMLVGVQAFPRKTITWLLLDRILTQVQAYMVGKDQLWECRFNFEIAPVMAPHGWGFVKYSAPTSERSRRTIESETLES